MDYVNRYPCPTCRRSFPPEKHLPLRLKCPSCGTRWFCAKRWPWLAGGYVLSYGAGMGSSFLWPDLSVAVPVFVFMTLMLVAFWKSLTVVSVDAMLAERAKLSRHPFSWIGLGLLAVAGVAGFVGATFLKYLTPLAVLVLGVLPPALTLISFRLTAYFRSRWPAAAVAALGLFLFFFAGVLPTGGPFLALILRLAGVWITLGATMGAGSPRGVPVD